MNKLASVFLAGLLVTFFVAAQDRTAQVGNVDPAPVQKEISGSEQSKVVSDTEKTMGPVTKATLLFPKMEGRWEFINTHSNRTFTGKWGIAIPKEVLVTGGETMKGKIDWQGATCIITDRDMVVKIVGNGASIETVLCSRYPVTITLIKGTAGRFLMGSYISEGTAIGTNTVYLNPTK